MKTITIRLDEELFKKAEAKRGNRPKSEFYRYIINEYLSNKSMENLNSKYFSDITKEIENLKSQLMYKDEIVRRMKDERIKDMQNQLAFLQLEYQKLSSQLLKSQSEAHKWWEFWK